MPIALDGIRTCTSGIRVHRAADYTTKVGPASRARARVCVCACVCVCQNDILHFVNTPTLDGCFGLVGHHQQGAECDPVESQTMIIRA